MPQRISYHRSVSASIRCQPATGPEPTSKTEKRLLMNRFYASARWRRLRRSFLIENPLCFECGKSGRVEPAIDVHHIKDRATNTDLGGLIGITSNPYVRSAMLSSLDMAATNPRHPQSHKPTSIRDLASPIT